AGVAGAACATLGVVVPSFLIIVGLSYALEAFSHLKAVQYAFWGIRAGVLALILKALCSLFQQCRKRWFEMAVMVLSFAAVAFLKVSAIAVILVCALLGIVLVRTGEVKA
ncbi:MAG: chromate transporter, partial [Clostridia bacterium]|nr:chromate transporter [Clostridia bacterium]